MDIPANNTGGVRTQLESLRDNAVVRQRETIQLELLLNATYNKHRIKIEEILDNIVEILSYNSSILLQNISLYETEQKIKEGNDTSFMWKKYYNDFETLYNNTHKDIDTELSKFGRNYEKNYKNGKLFLNLSKKIISFSIFITHEYFLLQILLQISSSKKTKVLLLILLTSLSFFIIIKTIIFFWNEINSLSLNSFKDISLIFMNFWKKVEDECTNDSIKLLFFLLFAYIFEDINNYLKNGKNKNSKKKRKSLLELLQRFENKNYAVISMDIFLIILLKYIFNGLKKGKDRYNLGLIWEMMN